MKLREETQEALLYLKLQEVSSEWIDSVWDDNFCGESVALPTEETALLSEENWERLVDTCKHWPQAYNREDVRVGFWTTLMEVGVSYKCVLALLYFMLEKSRLRPVDRVCAVHAAHLYVILLQLPSSGGHQLFHPMIFQKALNVFYLMQDEAGTYKTTGGRRGHKGGRGKRKRKAMVEEEDGDESDIMDTLSQGGSMAEPGGEDTVARLLKLLMGSLYTCLHHQSLAEYEASRYQLVQVLLHLTRKQLCANTSLLLGLPALQDQVCPIDDDAPMCVLAWGCLDVLCRPLHAPAELITSEVFRQLLPSLLMLSEDGAVVTSNPLPSSLVQSSKHALTFVEHVVRSTPGQVHNSLIKLIQHICTKIPDRAEYRNKMAVVVRQLLSLLPDAAYSDMLDWLYKFSRNIKVGYRVFALDVFSELAQLPVRTPQTGTLTAEASYRLSYKFLVRMMLFRCSDKAPSVRSRALSCLAMAAGSNSQDLVATVHSSIFPPTATNQEGNLIVEMVCRRTADDKVGVRKAGLQALEAIVRMVKSSTRNSDLVVIHERCLDPSLSVRKQAITSLTTILLERKDNKKLQSLWLDGVLPMVMDKEPGGEEKCLQLLQEVILDQLAPLNRSSGEGPRLAWQLLSLVAEENNLDLQRHLRRAVGQWARAGKLTRPLVTAVCSHVESEENLKACWLLLAELSQFCKFIETKFVYAQWNSHKESVSRTTSSPLVQILTVIGHLASSISRVAVEDIKEDIVELLNGFKLCPAVIQAAVNTLCLICSALTSKQEYQSSVDSWCVPLLKTCEEYISNLIQKKEGLGEESEVEICTYLFTLGEVAQLSPSHTSHHLCLMVQSILLASCKPSPTPPPSSQPCSQSSSVPSSQDPWPSSQRTLSLLAGLEGRVLSPSLRAHAYITLGKLCLQNEELAKKSVVQMGRELLTSQHPVVRNNIVVILCDLAVRYSTKVDPYISAISSCLKDECLFIRKQTLTLLARLLQEDYIKWRGSLFFHFVSTLVDPDMSKFAEFCLIHLLQDRHPDMFYRHFVECVFFFNGYKKHKVYNRFKQTEREKELFSLTGKKNAEKRMSIYTFLLSNMTDDQRFQLTAKLCHEVIGGLVDGVIPLDDQGVDVIKDTLAILASKEIKLTTLRRNIGEELAEEGDQVGAAVAKARTKIISHMVKRNVMENVMPIIIAAKHLFEKEHDPLLKDLMLYLKELMQDYRSEVNELLAGDPQLAQEIQFDLKRFDEEQRRAIQTPPTSVTPHAMMMSSLLSPGALGAVSMATVMATPPKLKTPFGSPKRTTSASAVRTPVRLPVGVSPLVVLHKVPLGSLQRPFSHTPLPEHVSVSTPKPPSRTPVRPLPHHDANVQDMGAQDQDTENQDISSPVAARAMVNAVSGGYRTIKSPATAVSVRKPNIPLQRAVLLSTARKAGLPNRLMNPASPVLADNTVLDGRLASTPEGLGEAISFHVSSLLPPSPIPASSVLRRPPDPTRDTAQPPQQGGARGRRIRHADMHVQSKAKDGASERRTSKRLKVAAASSEARADIVMTSPEAESRPLRKWGVQVKQQPTK